MFPAASATAPRFRSSARERLIASSWSSASCARAGASDPRRRRTAATALRAGARVEQASRCRATRARRRRRTSTASAAAVPAMTFRRTADRVARLATESTVSDVPSVSPEASSARTATAAGGVSSWITVSSPAQAPAGDPAQVVGVGAGEHVPACDVGRCRSSSHRRGRRRRRSRACRPGGRPRQPVAAVGVAEGQLQLEPNLRRPA